MRVIHLLLAAAQLALTVFAANQGGAPNHPAHHVDRTMVAGYLNATSGLAAFTAPVTGVSVAVSSSTGLPINYTSTPNTSSTLKEPFPVSIVTVTDRTTVTETSCSASSTLIKSLETASILPTSSLKGDLVKGIVPVTSSVSKTTSISAVKTPGTASVPSALGDQQISQSTVFVITKTAWTTTWTSITARTDAPTSRPLPTVHITRPIAGTAGTGTVRTSTSHSAHPTPKIPIIPNLPFGHPPAFFNGTIIRNHTTLSFYHEKPTVHPGAASVSTHHVSGSSTSHPAAKCTTTFQHSPTQACTSTSYAHTKTIAVDCYGCVGEHVLHVTGQAYHESKVCNNTATVTLPISRRSVCAGPMVATGGSVVSKSKSSSTHVASSGFVTSTSAGFQGSGYGHGNWTGRG